MPYRVSSIGARSPIADPSSRSVEGGSTCVRGTVAARLRTHHRWGLVAVLFVAVFFIQLPIILNADLGWLLTLDEKILDGAKFGVDVFESNPPLATYMYIPAVIVARVANVRPEWVVMGLVLVEIAAALFIIDRAGAAAGLSERERNVSCWTLAFLLAVLPGLVFGQREHIAVIALTPFVAVTALRWRGLQPGRIAILAGLGGGLALCLKPFFIAVLGLPLLLDAIRQRSLRPVLAPEAWAVATAAVSYAAGVAWAFPAYLFDYVPLVNLAYLPIRRGWDGLLPIPVALLGGCLLPIYLAARGNFKIWSDATPWLMAAVGGAGSFLLQGKGWPYTAYALSVFAMAAALLPVLVKTSPTSAKLAGAGMLALTGLYLSLQASDFPLLMPRVKALANHPRLLTITDDIELGHPLVRQLDGFWAGSSCAQLLAGGALWQVIYRRPTPDQRARLDEVIDAERRHLLADLRVGRPDVILADTYLLSSFRFDWIAWAMADPGIRTELESFHEVKGVGRVRIWVRNSA